ncbi:MAG: DUF4150 domain-containing protein [Planctomycetaceae bacterium]|nr:type VI secretion protein [Planctomycetota bacterium]NUO16986.1 DUF4150 domain-containing protein [Planctomycetaceae bacterium]
MMPAATRAGGVSMAFPDTCLVPAPPAPPVPTPFPNIAQMSAANPGTCTLKVKIMNQPAVVQNSQVMNSQGDEAGTNGGVVSGMNMGPASVKKGSAKVSLEGKPAATLLSLVAQNGASANAPAGNIIAPSQPKVLVMP